MVNILTSRGDRSLRSLVDVEKGVVDREVYINEEIYKQELEQIFARCWLFVAHESMVPNPGDFMISRMGEEEVIVTRDRKNKELHVFLNSCMHRGEKVCRYDEGNALLFTCPFHAWSYDTDGKLVGVAWADEQYGGALDKSQWGLPEARICNYYGSIWATWDRKAPTFEDYAGAYASSIRHSMQSSDGEDNGLEFFKPMLKWRIPTNWKVPAFSSSNDPAHAAMTHRSQFVAAFGPQGDDTASGGNNNPTPRMAPFPKERYTGGDHNLGHSGGYSFFKQTGAPDHLDTWLEPGVDEYYRMTAELKKKKYEGKMLPGLGHGASHFVIFPNTTIDSWRIRPRHPNGIGSTELFRLFPADKNAPKHVKDAMRHYQMRHTGPVGMQESDDMENWNYVYKASQGTIARRYPYNFQAGMGQNFTDDRLPGFHLSLVDKSEEGHRTRFSRWLAFMEAGSWDDLYPIHPDTTPEWGKT